MSSQPRSTPEMIELVRAFARANVSRDIARMRESKETAGADSNLRSVQQR